MTNYESAMLLWQQQKDETLRGPTGWLALAGLWWLAEGTNTIGSDSSCDIVLPAGAPARLGAINYQAGQAELAVTCPQEVQLNGEPVQEARLLADADEGGPSRLTIGPLTLIVIRRGEQAAVRVWDAERTERFSFPGRQWFPLAKAFRVKGVFWRHQPPRRLPVPNVLGMMTEIENPGRVEFSLAGRSCRLEALDGGPDLLWLIFGDATSGTETYGACRYLYAPLLPDGQVDLDFNRAYSPPCAFTPFATCSLPPAGNRLEIRVEAGERYGHADAAAIVTHS